MKAEHRRPGKGDGSDVLLAGERTGLNPNPSDSQTMREDAIATFAPWSDASERALRVRIHRARDSATARATRCRHGNARTIYWLAAQMAAERVFARIAAEDLKDTIANLARLFLVAGWIERTDAHDVE